MVRIEGEAFPHRGMVKGIAFAYFNGMGNRTGGVLALKAFFFKPAVSKAFGIRA